MADDWTSLASQIVSDTDTTFAVIANADGNIHARYGNLDHAHFANLLTVHCGDRDAVRRSSRSLDGVILPQSAAQGDAHIFRHRPSDGILVLVGKLIPRQSDSDDNSFATLIYQTGRALEDSIGKVFRRFSVR